MVKNSQDFLYLRQQTRQNIQFPFVPRLSRFLNTNEIFAFY